MTDSGMRTVRRVRWVLVAIMAFAVVAAAVAFANERPSLPARSYSEFLADVAAGRVDHVVQQGDVLTVEEGPNRFGVVVPTVLTNVYGDMQAAAAEAGRTLPATVYEAEQAPDNSWIGLVLTGILPLVVIGGFVAYMTRRAARTGARPCGLASRLEQLDEAKRLGRITAREYADKRAEILKGL